jgi:hypothetical protein
MGKKMGYKFALLFGFWRCPEGEKANWNWNWKAKVGDGNWDLGLGAENENASLKLDLIGWICYEKDLKFNPIQNNEK